MRWKMFMPDEVIRFFTYSFLFFFLSNISSAYSRAQFDTSPFKYNNDDIKEPDFSNIALDDNYQDLKSIYDDTAEMLYNSTGDGTHPDIHQVYPSQNQQNYTTWFDNLLNETNNANQPFMYNFSRLFPRANTSKDAYYRLPDEFRVFPDDRNVTLLNLKIPPNATKLNSGIFEDAFNNASSSKNDKEVYVNMPPIDSMSLNKTDNTKLVDQFFHTNISPLMASSVWSESTTKTPSIPTTSTEMSQMPFTAVLQRPTLYPINSTSEMDTFNTPSSSSSPDSNTSSSNSTATDLLAKKISEEETKNATSFIQQMLGKLGLERISLNGDPKDPMYVYKLNTTDDGTGNSSKPQNYTVPNKNFYFEGNNTNRSSLVLPLQNHPNTTSNSIPNLDAGSGYQSNLTYYGESVNMDMNKTGIPRNISFSAMVNDSVSDLYGGIVYTAVYFESGSSTPPHPYPKDPYGTNWTQGVNELTNDGKKQLFNLGKWLREKYLPMIGQQYNSSVVSIDSGASDIAITSGQSLAAGMFPPRENQIWDPLILWQPIPVRSIPTTDDNMILMTKYCEQYNLQTADLNKSPEWLQFYENNTETLNYIGQNIGYNFTKNNLVDALQKIFYCYEDLKTEEGNNLTLPNWTSTVYPDKMMYFAKEYIEYAVATRNLQKIKTGPFFKNIISSMTAKINNSTNATSAFSETMHLYSGDALGIGFIMKTLGIFNSIIPPNASALIFDLRYKENDFLVTVSYKNSSSDTQYVLTVPYCNPVCRFSQFVEITNDLMLDDWDNYCETISIFDLTYTIPIAIFGIAIIFILALVIILLIVKCCKNIRKKKASFG